MVYVISVDQVKVLLFCDDSTLNPLLSLLGNRVCAVVLARPSLIQEELPEDIPVLIQPTSKSGDLECFVDQIVAISPEVIVSFSYSRLIPESIYSLATVDAVNIHGGLLPEFRGANALNWALVLGLDTTGVTLHALSEKFDEGDIAFRDLVTISPLDTALTLRDRLTTVGCDQISRALTLWDQRKSLPKYPQDRHKAKYLRRRTPEDGLVSCKNTNVEIYNMIRALVDPWPGAIFVSCDGERHVINEFIPLEKITALRAQWCTCG